MIDSLRSLLHRHSVGVILINLRRIVRQRLILLRFDDELWVRRMYERRTGRHLDLKSPARFTEKLQWLKLHYRDPLMVRCADKAQVRSYISERGYADLLMPVLGYFRKVGDIPFCDLPPKCILKASHGSSMHLVKTVSVRRIPLAWKAIMWTWLHMDIYAEGREWPYRDVPHGIIVEEFVESATGESLTDYKLFCFDGEATFVQVDTNLLGDHRIDFYDANWNRLPIRCQYPNSENGVPKPQYLERMKSVAADLSSPFPHVRVDFYGYDDELRIGEMTFFDGSGFYSFHPDEWDFVFGERIVLRGFEEGK